MDILHICVAFLVSLSALQSDCSNIRRYKSNLVLYSGYTSNDDRVIYTDLDSSEWKDLTKISGSAGLSARALMCGVGTGAWITYPKSDFQPDTTSHSYAKILIGDTCVSAENLESVQSVGPINKDFHGLLAFTAPFFGSEPTLLSTEDNETTSADGVASLLSYSAGSGEWLVEGGGKKICVTLPKGVLSTGICIIPDLETEFGMPTAKVTVGCPEGKEKLETSMDIIPSQLQTCFIHVGAYQIVSNYLKLPVISTICKSDPDPSTKLGFQRIVDAWKFRMNPRRQLEINPANIDKDMDEDDAISPMRMELLTNFFEIVKEGCEGTYISEWYFNLIRYQYMQHLKTVWEDSPHIVIDKNDTKFTWTDAYQYLKDCHARRIANPVPTNVKLNPSCPSFNPFERPQNSWEGQVLDLLLEGDVFDHVIEQVWIMLNYVSPYCAEVSDVKDNLWAEFVTFFRRQFLLPVVQQWVNPGSWQIFYEYMFNGVSIQRGKRMLIACVQNLLRETPSGGEPLDRPSAIIKNFLSVNKKRPPLPMSNVPEKKPKSRKKRDYGSVRRSRDTKHQHHTPKPFSNAALLQEKAKGKHHAHRNKGNPHGSRVR